MSRIIRTLVRPPIACTSQPQGSAQINWSDPITRGLSSAFPSLACAPAYGEGNLYHNTNSDNALCATRIGTGRRYTRNGYNSTTSGTVITGLTEVSGTSQQTMMLQGIRGAYDDTGAFLIDGNFDVWFSSSGQLTYDFGGGSGATTKTVAVGEPYTIFMWAAGSYITAVDLKGDVVSTVGGLDWATGRAPTSIGCRAGWGLINGVIVSFHRWKRFLTTEERALLRENPWRIYQKDNRIIPAMSVVRGPALTRQSRLLGTSSGSASAVSTLSGLRKVVTIQQPQGPANIDWSNPITAGLSLVSTGDMSVNLVTKLSHAYVAGSGTLSKVATSKGTGWTASGTGGASLNGSGGILGNGDITALFFGNPTANSLAQTPIYHSATSGKIWFSANNDENETPTNGQLCLGLLETGVNRSSVKVAGAIDGTFSAYLVGKKSGSGLAYKNGVKLTTTTTGTLGGSPSTGSPSYKLLGNNAAGGSECTGWTILVCAWNRLLSDAEAASITSNPWQIFKAPSKPLWVSV